MQTFTAFLKKNPNLLSKYVIVGTAMVDAVVQPLNKFMKHLLLVQDIDPNTQPVDREYAELSAQLNQALSGLRDNEDYTGPFADEAWLAKCLKRAKSKISDLDEKAFRKMTDLSLLPDRQEEEPLQVSLSGGRTVKEVMESEKPVYTSDDQDVFARMAAKDSVLDNSIKKALESLKDYIATLPDPPKTEAFVVSRAPTVIGTARRYPSYTKVVKSFKNGIFRRVADKKE